MFFFFVWFLDSRIFEKKKRKKEKTSGSYHHMLEWQHIYCVDSTNYLMKWKPIYIYQCQISTYVNFPIFFFCFSLLFVSILAGRECRIYGPRSGYIVRRWSQLLWQALWFMVAWSDCIHSSVRLSAILRQLRTRLWLESRRELQQLSKAVVWIDSRR